MCAYLEVTVHICGKFKTGLLWGLFDRGVQQVCFVWGGVTC